MLRISRLFTILVLVALLFSACQPIQAPASSVEPAPAKGYTPIYEPADCKYEVPEGDQIECGYLTVPEDRSQPDGRMIRLYVVNFKSKSKNPAPDPVVILHSGPGGVVPWFVYMWTQTPIAELRADRDNILIEQRGANYSEPGLFCPEMEAGVADMAGMGFTEEIEWSMAASRACAARLQQEGINLSTYSALAVAADVLDLREAMGYEQINVFGPSGGSWPAMQVMRYDQTGIRSYIIDSATPLEISGTAEMLGATYSMLNAIFQACADDDACHAAYPDPETVFYQVVAQLHDAPVTVTATDEAGQSYAVTIDDLKFINFIRDSAFVGFDYLQVPALIAAAAQGDFVPAAQAWLGRVAYRHGETGPGSWTLSLGLYFTMNCLQDGTVSTAEEAKAAYDKVGGNASVYDWAVTTWISDTLAVCPDWQLTPPTPNIAIEPVRSDVPTLLLAGAFDNYAPPYLMQPIADGLPNSFYFELPAGHASLFTPCGLGLIKQFLADPTQAPDASCIDEMTLDWVLPEE